MVIRKLWQISMDDRYPSAGTNGNMPPVNKQDSADIVKFHSQSRCLDWRYRRGQDLFAFLCPPLCIYISVCYLIMASYSHTRGSLTQYAEGSAGQRPWTQSGSVHTLFAQPGFLAPATPYLHYLPSLTHLHSPILTLADWSVCSESKT